MGKLQGSFKPLEFWDTLERNRTQCNHFPLHWRYFTWISGSDTDPNSSVHLLSSSSILCATSTFSVCCTTCCCSWFSVLYSIRFWIALLISPTISWFLTISFSNCFKRSSNTTKRFWKIERETDIKRRTNHRHCENYCLLKYIYFKSSVTWRDLHVLGFYHTFSFTSETVVGQIPTLTSGVFLLSSCTHK